MDSNLMIKKIVFERDEVEDFSKYPFNIEIIKNLEELELTSPVTFLVGENGIGKSTLIELLPLL